MARTPEADLKDKVKEYLKNLRGTWFFMPVPFGFGVKGIPDFIGCWRGKFFAIETKAPKGKPTPWQERTLTAIKEAGGMCCVAWDLEDVKNMFRKAVSNEVSSTL